MGIAEDIIIIIVFGLIAGLILHKIRLPLFLGYILIGILIGPHTGLVTITDVHQIELLAEIGVALLLFSIGLDLSIRELLEVKYIAIAGTLIQITASIFYGYGIGWYFGFSLNESIVLGVLLSLSSTMIVLKVLMNRGLVGTLSSKVMIGILIVQDLAAIPMMIIIPKINFLTGNIAVLGLTFLKGITFLAVVILLGRKVIPFILKSVARLNSQELFLLSVAGMGLGVGLLSHLSGLSFAFGAFVAGIVLSESDYSYKALSDIVPLRDIFGLLFFVSIGMLFNPLHFTRNFLVILELVTLVTIGKFLLFFFISRIFGYYNIIPLAVGLGLAQVGEFSFVISTLGLNEKIITAELYSIFLSMIVLTMFLSPFLSMLAAPLYAAFKRRSGSETVKIENFPATELDRHIVISGGGRVGLTIGTVLSGLGLSFIIIEQDFRNFEKIKKLGFPVIYGDACQESVLHAANLKKSRLLLITIPALIITRKIINISKIMKPDLNIIARVENPEQLNELYKLNVFELVQPEFEASLEIIRQSLIHFDMPVPTIQQYLDEIRQKKYSPLHQQSYNYKILSGIKNASLLFQMYWVRILPHSKAHGRAIKDMNIRTLTGASIVGVYRDDLFIPNPGPDFLIKEEDYIAIIGDHGNRDLFDKLVNVLTD